ncbi:MAG: cytochrome bc complex cytochrome b subunit, partial [bacterium]
MQEIINQDSDVDFEEKKNSEDKQKGIVGWVEDRFSLAGLKDFFAHKKVPIHRHSLWYYLGGITLFFFVIQVITGMMLLFYYRPAAESAFESVQFIMTEVRFGWLIRSIHSWSANLMVAAAFIHLFSVFFMRAYRKPRELTWVTGVLMLFFAMGFGFSGYLLPWNELAFFATKVGTEIVAVVPIVGQTLMEFLRGGEDVTGATLTRFFAIHVAILPFLFFILLAFHLLVVQIQGMSVPPGIKKKSRMLKVMPFFPNFLLRDLLGWIVALGCLVAIAALFPWELGVKADPFAPAPAGIKPEWYFFPTYRFLKLVP